MSMSCSASQLVRRKAIRLASLLQVSLCSRAPETLINTLLLFEDRLFVSWIEAPGIREMT